MSFPSERTVVDRTDATHSSVPARALASRMIGILLYKIRKAAWLCAQVLAAAGQLPCPPALEGPGAGNTFACLLSNHPGSQKLKSSTRCLFLTRENGVPWQPLDDRQR